MTSKKKLSYKDAGVDLKAGIGITSGIGRLARSTFNSSVLADIGSFGGLFCPSPKDMKDPVLVSSTDGVGTKVILAARLERTTGVGQDIVNHCVNDILVQGAKPLFFLDYIAFPKFKGSLILDVMKGLAKACRENSCVLLGGETAEMPGVYQKDHFDLVGTIVGIIDRKKIITGKAVRPGDILIGLPSSGLHTNGYSLARKIVEGKNLNRPFTGKKSLADLLLAPHRSYLKSITALMKQVTLTGMSHITGGGFPYNIRRILPKGIRAVVDTGSWIPPPLFSYLEKKGNVDHREMFDVFNMGIGMVLILPENQKIKAVKILKSCGEKPQVIGKIEKADKTSQSGHVQLLFPSR